MGSDTILIFHPRIGQPLSHTSQDALGHWTDFAYDAVGNRTSITDSQGNRTEVSYNLRGERIQLIDPDMGQWDYGLDALGQQSWVWDGNGDFIDSQYDLLGRRTARWLRGGPGQNQRGQARIMYFCMPTMSPAL